MTRADAGSALDGLDPILNAPKRLAVMAVLEGSQFAEFGFLRGCILLLASNNTTWANIRSA